MKIATWNVNSIIARLPQTLNWISSARPDVLCLQEIKCIDERFPAEPFRELGYEISSFGQPTYNGVAILSLLPQENVQRGLPDDDAASQRRLLAATIAGVRVVNIYVPNGAAVGADKYVFKLEWLRRLRLYFEQHCNNQGPLVLCGDFNIAPEDRDVHDPILWYGKILCSEPERAALRALADWGLVDVFRRHHQESGLYSWWDYRMNGFRRNHGLRIDHLWATPPLAAQSVDAWIDKVPRALERPSDHTPVVAEFAGA